MRSPLTWTSSKVTSASSSVPLACSIVLTSTPGERRSTMNAVRAAMSGIGRTGSGEDETPGGVPRPTRPDLPTVDDVAIAVALRGRSDRGEVGAGVGLRETLGPQLSSRQVLRHRLGHEWPRPHGDERRRQDLQVLVQRHPRNTVAGQRLPHHRPMDDRAAQTADARRPAVSAPAVVVQRGHEIGHRRDAFGVVRGRGLHPLQARGACRQPRFQPSGVGGQVRIEAGAGRQRW